MPPKVSPRRRLGRASRPPPAVGPARRALLDYEEMPDYVEDRDRFAGPDARMAMLDSNINAYGAEINAAMQRKNAKAGNPAAADPRPCMLQWTTPPSSPTSIKAVGARGLRSMRQRMGADLDNVAMNFLVENNRLRNLLEDLIAIREWWGNNRNEWTLRRQEVQSFQRNIDALIVQLGGIDKIDRSPHADAKQQYRLQIEVSNSRLEWFRENEELMRLVQRRVDEIRKQAEKIIDQFRKKPMAHEFDFPNGFSLEDEFALFKFENNSVTWWNNGAGFPSWAKNAAQYMVWSMQNNRWRQILREESLELVKQAITDVKFKWQARGRPENLTNELTNLNDQLRRNAGRERTSHVYATLAAQNRKRIVQIEADLAAAARIEAANTGYLNTLRDQRLRLVIELSLLKRERDRDRTIRDAAEPIAGEAKNRDAAYFLRRVHFIQHFVQICHIHYVHSKYVSSILAMLQDDALRQADREKIYQMIQNHHTEYRDSHSVFITQLSREEVRWKNNGLEQLVTLPYEYEYEAMGNLVFDVKAILSERKAEARAAVTLATVRKIALGDGQMLNQEVIATLSEPLGSVGSLDHAMARLATEIEVIDGCWKPAKDALRDLFVSPDVAPYFQLTYRVNRRHFIDLLNSFVRTPIADVLVESFLMHCNNVGELFTINFGKIISAQGKGWETVEEMPVAGPARNVRVVKPIGVDNFETWLVKNKDAIPFIRQDREITTYDLFNLTVKSFPRMTEEQFMGAMQFFSKVGRLYTYPIKQPARGSTMVRRIDNGWNINAAIPYPQLLTAPEPYFAQLETIFQSDEAKALVSGANFTNLIENETQLYDVLSPILQVQGGFFGIGNIIITRHRFHLFLRWCHQNQNLLQLSRDGTITRI
ncbi:hypothetical protein BDZ45DRAFT_694035 [Acephala macrosclerotiorum]|nr:hypothetical protein BDZ45DRAFT_694035 [Acephala macrosclerotiorum]